MVKNLVILLHGRTGSGTGVWQPWVRNQCTNADTMVFSPTFPDSANPDYQIWKEHFEKILKSYDKYERLYIVGHSLGGYFALLLLGEFLSAFPKLAGVIFVTPATINNPQRLPFYGNQINWDQVRQLKVPIKILYSIDDTVLLKEHTDLLMKELKDSCDIEYKEYQNYGHFVALEYNEIVDAIKEITSK